MTKTATKRSSTLDVGRLDERIAEGIAKAKVASVSLAVVHEGELIHANGYGVTSTEEGGVRVTPSTIFRIASTSKPITATVLLQLVGEGLLELDAPIKEYIPWFKLSDPEAAEVMTVRQVMSSRSGLPVDAGMKGSHDPEGLESYVRDKIPEYTLAAPPGKIFIYSNPAINLAGYIAEAVSGIHFADLVQQHLFDPLGMERSTFDPLVAMTYPLVQAHSRDEDGNLSVVHRFPNNVASYPCGGVYSTAMDMAKYAQMLMNDGKADSQQILGSRELAEMTTPHNRTFWPNFPPSTSYGLMLFVGDYKGRRKWGHAGGAGGFLHTFEMMPDTRTAVIVQTNGSGEGFNGHVLANEIIDEILDLPSGWTDPTLEPDRGRWDGLVGTYVGETGHYGGKAVGSVTIDVVGDQLVADYQGIKRVLSARAEDFYFAEPSEEDGPFVIGFIPEADDSVDWVSVNMQPAQRVREAQ